jgi:hypothetical protein
MTAAGHTHTSTVLSLAMEGSASNFSQLQHLLQLSYSENSEDQQKVDFVDSILDFLNRGCD